MSKYKVVYEYYAGFGENDVSEQVIDSREKLVEILNNVFKGENMITSMKIYKLRPDGSRSHALDEKPQYTPEETIALFQAKTDLINSMNEKYRLTKEI